MQRISRKVCKRNFLVRTRQYLRAAAKKDASARTADRKPYFLAQYKGREVSVLGLRGGVKFVLTMSGAVASAIVRNGVLSVETIDGSTFSYEAATGRLLSAAPAPVAVVSAASTSRVSAA